MSVDRVPEVFRGEARAKNAGCGCGGASVPLPRQRDGRRLTPQPSRCGCGGDAKQLSRPGREGSFLCGNCLADATVAGGFATPHQVRHVLSRWGGSGTVEEVFSYSPQPDEPLDSNGRLRAGAGPILRRALVDTTGAGACSPSRRASIEAAFAFIRANLADIPASGLTAGQFWWLPAGWPRNARALVDRVLNGFEKNLRVHCVSNSNVGCLQAGTVAWTVPQQSQLNLDIYICSRTWGMFSRTSTLACLLVHELMHALGVVSEQGAEAAEPNQWNCFSPGATVSPFRQVELGQVNVGNLGVGAGGWGF